MEMAQRKIFAEHLIYLRDEKGLSQQQLATETGINRETIARYETFKRIPSYEHLTTLARHFNTTTDYLLGLSSSSKRESDITAACNCTGLTAKSIQNICNMNESEIIDDNKFSRHFTVVNPIMDKHKINLFNYLLENEALTDLLYFSLEYAIEKIKFEIEKQEEGPSRLLDDQNGYADYKFMNQIRSLLGDSVISYCQKVSIMDELFDYEQIGDDIIEEMTAEEYNNWFAFKEVKSNGNNNPKN